jgi:hypothetical protein
MTDEPHDYSGVDSAKYEAWEAEYEAARKQTIAYQIGELRRALIVFIRALLGPFGNWIFDDFLPNGGSRARFVLWGSWYALMFGVIYYPQVACPAALMGIVALNLWASRSNKS